MRPVGSEPRCGQAPAGQSWCRNQRPPMHTPLARSVSPVRLVALVCAAPVLAQIGAYAWPALIPGLMGAWAIDNTQAGWITGPFYLAYLVSVPGLGRAACRESVF